MSKIVDAIVIEHVQLAAFLWTQREMLMSAPVPDPDAIDDAMLRIDANLDAIEIAGQPAWPFILSQYEDFREAGELFVGGFLAITTDDKAATIHCLELARQTPKNLQGLAGAFAWFPPHRVSQQIRDMLDAPDEIRRAVAVDVLARHAADPKDRMMQLVADTSPLVRSAAFRLAAAAGRDDCAEAIAEHATSEDTGVRFAAGVALARLGHPAAAKRALEVDVVTGSHTALRTLASAMPQKDFISFLTDLHTTDDTRPYAVRGLGMTGERGYLSWLIKQMGDPHLSVAAGESFLELFPEAEGVPGLFSDDPDVLGEALWEVADASLTLLPVSDSIAAWAKDARASV